MRSAPTYEDVLSKQVMNKVTAPSMPFGWSLNPYRGCTHGCSFCYARSTHTYLGFDADDTFRNHVLVKDNVAAVLKQQLTRKLQRAGGNHDKMVADIGLLAIGTATDPYQPVEAQRQLTRDCLKVLAEFQVLTSITTRSPLILRDVDILSEMNLQSIHVSVNTMDVDVWRNLEPATPAPRRRIETVQKLKESLLPADVFLAPIIPCLTDSIEDLGAVIEAAAESYADSLWPSVLRLSADVREWFMKTLATTYPHLVRKYEKLYRISYPPHWYVNPLMNNVHQLLRDSPMYRSGLREREKSAENKIRRSTRQNKTRLAEAQDPSRQSGEQARLPI